MALTWVKMQDGTFHITAHDDNKVIAIVYDAPDAREMAEAICALPTIISIALQMLPALIKLDRAMAEAAKGKSI